LSANFEKEKHAKKCWLCGKDQESVMLPPMTTGMRLGFNQEELGEGIESRLVGGFKHF
jgi:hypothetical protein